MISRSSGSSSSTDINANQLATIHCVTPSSMPIVSQRNPNVESSSYPCVSDMNRTIEFIDFKKENLQLNLKIGSKELLNEITNALTTHHVNFILSEEKNAIHVFLLEAKDAIHPEIYFIFLAHLGNFIHKIEPKSWKNLIKKLVSTSYEPYVELIAELSNTNALIPLAIICHANNFLLNEEIKLSPDDRIKSGSFEGVNLLCIALDWKNTPIAKKLIASASPETLRAATVAERTSLHGVTPIHSAILAGEFSIVRSLIQDHKVDFSKALLYGSRAGWNPLTYSIQLNKTDIAKYLIEKAPQELLESCIINPTHHSHGLRPITLAVINKNLEIVQSLVERGINYSSCRLKGRNHGWNPIHHAVHNNSIASLKYLVKYVPKNVLEDPIDNPESSFDGFRPVDIAARLGHLEIIKCLVENKIDFTTPSETKDERERFSPLRRSIYFNHTAVAIYLIKNSPKEELEKSSVDGLTPMAAAAQEGNLEIAQCLMEHKVDFLNPLQGGWCVGWYPLTFAIKMGHTVLAKYLIQITPREILNKYIIAVEKNYDYFRHIDVAAYKGNLAITQDLIEHGVDINSPILSGNFKGWYALVIAIQQNHTSVATYLIKKTPKKLLNKCIFSLGEEGHGVTPLDVAVRAGNLEIVQFLVECGVDLSPCQLKGNNEGWTPLHHAIERKFTIMVQYLIKKNPELLKISMQWPGGEDDTICMVAKRGDLKTLQYLIEHIDFFNSQFESIEDSHHPLIFAFLNKKTAVAKYLIDITPTELLEKPFITSRKSPHTKTIMSIAMEKNREIVDYLRKKLETKSTEPSSTQRFYNACKQGILFLVSYHVKQQKKRPKSKLLSNRELAEGLYFTCEAQKESVVQYLLDNINWQKADLNHRFEQYERYSPLMIAIQKGSVEIVKKLFSHKVNEARTSKENLLALTNNLEIRDMIEDYFAQNFPLEVKKPDGESKEIKAADPSEGKPVTTGTQPVSINSLSSTPALSHNLPLTLSSHPVHRRNEKLATNIKDLRDNLMTLRTEMNILQGFFVEEKRAKKTKNKTTPEEIENLINALASIENQSDLVTITYQYHQHKRNINDLKEKKKISKIRSSTTTSSASPDSISSESKNILSPRSAINSTDTTNALLETEEDIQEVTNRRLKKEEDSLAEAKNRQLEEDKAREEEKNCRIEREKEQLNKFKYGIFHPVEGSLDETPQNSSDLGAGSKEKSNPHRLYSQSEIEFALPMRITPAEIKKNSDFF